MENLVLFVMRKITWVCLGNLSAEIFQPSAFSMAGGIFFGGFSNGDNRYGEDWKKDKRDKEKIRNDDQTGTGSLRDICCCGVQVAERTGNANTGQSYHPGRSMGC